MKKAFIILSLTLFVFAAFILLPHVRADSEDVTQLTAKTYIAPITLLGHLVYTNDQELVPLLAKIGYGSATAATGFSIGTNYVVETYGKEKNYDFNPSGVNDAIKGSISYKLPFLVHANGYKWVPIHRFDDDRSVAMWDQNGKTYMDLPGYVNMKDYDRAGSWLWSLNEFNTKYLSLKEKTFRQLARVLADFNKSYPDLFIGMSLDSEITMLAAAWYPQNMYSYDYNPDTILQWKMYLAGNNWPTGLNIDTSKNSPYINSGRLKGRGLNLTLAQINVRYGANYASYLDILPPRVDESLVKSSGSKIFRPEQGTSMQKWDDWQAFKESMIHDFLSKMVTWAKEEGVPAEKVFTHQPISTLGDGPESEGAFWASLTTTPDVQGAGYGYNAYGSGVRNLDLFSLVKKINPLWGIMEWNPMTTADTLSALNEVWNYGAKVVCPNYFLSVDDTNDASGLAIRTTKDSTGSIVIDQIGAFIKSKNGQNKQITGFVDGWVGNSVVGWVCDLSEPNRPLKIEALDSKNQIIATSTADLPRADVVANACGSSHRYHGFSIEITDPGILASRSINVSVGNPFTGVKKTLNYTASIKQGDLNMDGKVDNSDYSIFASNFGQTVGQTGGVGFTLSDIDKNGKVDIFDYNVLVENFGK